MTLESNFLEIVISYDGSDGPGGGGGGGGGGGDANFNNLWDGENEEEIEPKWDTL